jgi:hypothetical protein
MFKVALKKHLLAKITFSIANYSLYIVFDNYYCVHVTVNNL